MRHKESSLQIACVRWFKQYAYPRLAPLLFAVPNGGYRNPVTAKIMKAEGATAGVADLILLAPSAGFHGLCIEMKTDKGRQSENQKQWQTALENQGYKYVVCRSFEDFQTEVTRYLREG